MTEIIPLGQVRKLTRLEIVESGPNDVPEMLTLSPAQIDDHDSFSAHPVKNAWPSNLAPSTLKLHQVFAWSLNPFRLDTGTASVDQYAETQGKSRFSFTSKIALDDFLEYYMLDDFVVNRTDASRSDAFHFLTLTNKFLPSEIEQFFAVYRDAINALTVINEERMRAIRFDGNKVGHVFVDHFSARETHELMRIKMARIQLGASGLERTK